jgi:hypothetical protein
MYSKLQFNFDMYKGDTIYGRRIHFEGSWEHISMTVGVFCDSVRTSAFARRLQEVRQTMRGQAVFSAERMGPIVVAGGRSPCYAL